MFKLDIKYLYPHKLLNTHAYKNPVQQIQSYPVAVGMLWISDTIQYEIISCN